MTPDEARALIADGRQHDKATKRAEPPCTCVDRNPQNNGCYGHGDCPRMVHRAAVCDAQTWVKSSLASLLDFAELGVLAHERDHRPFDPGQRDLVIEVCHDLINRAMRNESDPIPDQRYADDDRAKEAAIRAMLDGYAEAQAEVERMRAELDHSVSENFAFNLKVATEINEARADRDRCLREVETLRSEVSRLRDVEVDLAHDLDQARDIIAGVDPEDSHP